MKARLTFFENIDELYSALSPETGFSKGRSKVEVKKSGGVLHIDINSSDITSMRAAVNAYLRMAQAALECLEVIEDGNTK